MGTHMHGRGDEQPEETPNVLLIQNIDCWLLVLYPANAQNRLSVLLGDEFVYRRQRQVADAHVGQAGFSLTEKAPLKRDLLLNADEPTLAGIYLQHVSAFTEPLLGELVARQGNSFEESFRHVIHPVVDPCC